MMSRWLYTLVKLLIFNLLTKYAAAALSSYGTRFLIAIPKVDEQHKEIVNFLLGTMASKIQVQITTNHFEGDQLKDSVTIRRSRVTRYVLDKAFTPQIHGYMESFTYELNSEASFSLTVLLYQSEDTVSSFLALPLGAWGKKYMLCSIGENPTYHFVTLEATELRIFVDGWFENVLTYIIIDKKSYRPGETIEKIKVNSRRSFMISHCSFQNTTVGVRKYWAMVNSTEPIGVIAGNCKSSLPERRCDNKTFQTSEAGLEMAFPDVMYGTEFIYWSFITNIKQIVIYGENNLMVTVGNDSHVLKENSLKRVVHGCGLIKAPKPVMVLLMLDKRCALPNDTELMGDLYYTHLVPNALFSVFYLWRVPVVNLINFLTLVVETEFIDTTMLDDSKLQENVQWVVGLHQITYSVAMFEIPSGSHTVRSNVNRKFGCYISGINRFMGHVHPAGLSNCVHEDKGTGQDVCIGGTDEESYTYGLSESNLHHLGLGIWSDWRGWTCNQKGVKVRTRSCENRKACRGMHDDISDEPCKPSDAQTFCARGIVILIIIFIVVTMVNY